MDFVSLRILIDGKGCFIDLIEKTCLVCDFKIKLLSRYPSLIPNNYVILIQNDFNLPLIPLGTDQICKYCKSNSMVILILQKSYYRSYKKNPNITNLILPRTKIPEPEIEKSKIHIQSVYLEPYKKQFSKLLTANERLSLDKFQGFFVISPHSLPPEPIINYNKKFQINAKLTTKYYSSCNISIKDFEKVNYWMSVLIIHIIKKRKNFKKFSNPFYEEETLLVNEESVVSENSNTQTIQTTTQKFSSNLISQLIDSVIEKIEIKYERWDPFYFLPWFVPKSKSLSSRVDPFQYSLKKLNKNLNGDSLSKELKEFAKKRNLTLDMIYPYRFLLDAIFKHWYEAHYHTIIYEQELKKEQEERQIQINSRSGKGKRNANGNGNRNGNGNGNRNENRNGNKNVKGNRNGKANDNEMEIENETRNIYKNKISLFEIKKYFKKIPKNKRNVNDQKNYYLLKLQIGKEVIPYEKEFANHPKIKKKNLKINQFSESNFTDEKKKKLSLDSEKDMDNKTGTNTEVIDDKKKTQSNTSNKNKNPNNVYNQINIQDLFNNGFYNILFFANEFQQHICGRYIYFKYVKRWNHIDRILWSRGADNTFVFKDNVMTLKEYYWRYWGDVLGDEYYPLLVPSRYHYIHASNEEIRQFLQENLTPIYQTKKRFEDSHNKIMELFKAIKKLKLEAALMPNNQERALKMKKIPRLIQKMRISQRRLCEKGSRREFLSPELIYITPLTSLITHFSRNLQAIFYKIQNQTKLEKFQQQLGFRFKNITLLKTAMTHSSVLHEQSKMDIEDNERLEFLGDAILDWYTSLRLFFVYRDASEGQLTDMRSLLVKNEILSKMGKVIGLDEVILVNEHQTTLQKYGRARSSVLADTVEALIGAYFLDQGFECVCEFIRRILIRCKHNFENENVLKKYFQSLRLIRLKQFIDLDMEPYWLIKGEASGNSNKNTFIMDHYLQVLQHKKEEMHRFNGLFTNTGEPADLSELEKKINIKFTNAYLLKTAFTHVTYENSLTNYERLEFLGDNFLKFASSIHAYNKFPKAPEGQLTKIVHRYVENACQIDISLDLELENYLLFSNKGFPKTREKKIKILGDLYESLVGAIVQDKGLETAFDFVGNTLISSKNYLPFEILNEHPKSILLQFAQLFKQDLPQLYSIVHQNQPIFGYYFLNKIIAIEKVREKKIAEKFLSLKILQLLWAKYKYQYGGETADNFFFRFKK
ncbi:dicer-related [Anaeramoeba flamelloides]|uniref:Dicer-related n=1 Tax=Anaeramoeba flamelloides TaxID=1746091 RepID=A0ABQ8YT91_9EUKA|nr:dicer-related [Anaeramoeba flamelloides]